MKPLVAIDPVETEGKTFERFCEALNLFYERGLLSDAIIGSAIHSALSSVPHQWYAQMKDLDVLRGLFSEVRKVT